MRTFDYLMIAAMLFNLALVGVLVVSTYRMTRPDASRKFVGVARRAHRASLASRTARSTGFFGSSF